MRSSLLLLFLCTVGTLCAQPGTLTVPITHYGLDVGRKLVVIHLPATDRPAGITTKLSSEGLTLTLIEALREVRYDSVYVATDPADDSLSVYFTRLPLVKIVTDTTLNQYEHRPATFSYADGKEVVESPMGIRHRGSFSLRFPKKSLDLEFWADKKSRESTDVTFGNLRKDDDWVLDALYNEPLRVNSYVAHKVWLDLHTPYYADKEPEAASGADVRYVEVFYNGTYNGLFMLSEQVDRKQLKLKKFKDGQIRGELYKSIQYSDATLFRGQPRLVIERNDTYASWELTYPDTDDTLTYANLYNLLGFVANTPDSVFRAGAAGNFRLDNIRDYFLYLNAMSLTDNDGKNTYLARYTAGSPYFYAPWDLDAGFGNDYKGDRDPRTDLWIVNGLQTRLLNTNPDGYKAALCDRYNELRQGLFAPDSLIARLDRQIAYLKDNGVYARETLRWGNSVNVSDDQIAYTRQHTSDRIAFLDANVCGLFTPVRPFMAPVAPPLVVYPNPVAQRLYVRHDLTQPTAYTLSNTAGQRVATGYLGGEQESIDVNGLPAGMYLLRVDRRVVRVVVSR